MARDLQGQSEEKNIVREKRTISVNDVPLSLRLRVEQEENAIAVESIKDSCKSPSEINWELFKGFRYGSNGVNVDDTEADKYLQKYISVSVSEGKSEENLCFLLFQMFWKGDRGLSKSMRDAVAMLPILKKSSKVVILESLIVFYEEQHNVDEVARCYYSLYEIFHNGIGVVIDQDKAETYLKESLKRENADYKREDLRRLYARDYTEDSQLSCEDYCYQRLIQEKVQMAEYDYAVYLSKIEKSDEAIHWFVQAGDYRSAYVEVDILDKKKIEHAVKVFQDARVLDNVYKDSLLVIRDNFKGVKGLFACRRTLSFLGMSWRYSVFSAFYAFYRAFKLSKLLFISGLLGYVFIAVTGIVEEAWYSYAWWSLLWTAIMLLIDIWRRNRWLNGCQLWEKIEKHRQLAVLNSIFYESKEILSRKPRKNSLVVAFSILLILALPGFFPPEMLASLSKAQSATKTVSTVKQENMSVSKALSQQKNPTDQAASQQQKELKPMTYTRFTDNAYGFSFDYPQSLPPLTQGDDYGGTAATRYGIKLSPNFYGVACVEFAGGRSINLGRDIEHEIHDDTKQDVQVKKINEYTYTITWKDSNAWRYERKVFLVMHKGQMQRQVIEFRYRGEVDPNLKVIAQHITDSFVEKK